jgi:hypothetical protein
MNASRFDAAWLMQQKFPAVQYVVPGIIPEGMTLLVAAPKIGKSWMVLGLGVELARGGLAFGVVPTGKPRPVLYLALEDGPRRLQDRLLRLNPDSISANLEFITQVPQGEVLSTIREFMNQYVGHDPVVILDTLGKVMPPAGNGSQYGHDYKVLSDLKATSDAVPGSSLVIVHHTRKMDAGDFLDAVSGTQGIAGAADTVLLLKRERQEKRATLHVTSRDAAEGEYALTLTDNGRWELDGDSLAQASESAKLAKATAGLGDKSTDVINKIADFPAGISPAELKVLLPDINPSTIDVYLKRAFESGRIAKSSRGKYTPVRTVSSESSVELSYGSDASYGSKGAKE